MTSTALKSLTRMFGIELEFFFLDKQGRISNNADRLLKELKGKLPNTEIKKECGKSMIELCSFPHKSSREVFSNFIKDMEELMYSAEVNDLALYNKGTYPGRNINEMRKDKRYDAQKQILGKRQFQNAGKCIGFHFHYTLPRNVFNHKQKFFFPDLKLVKRKKIVNLFNLYIALDPALATFMQSSPYFEGKLMGKDSRMVMYRGDPVFNSKESVYSLIPKFGKLNNYTKDFDSLTNNILNQSKSWKRLLRKRNLSFKDFIKKDMSPLDTSWKPVKLSTHGTIESRGCDMNSFEKTIAIFFI